MIVKRSDSNDADFRTLVAELDEYLAEVDGDEHSYYAQFNGLDSIPHVVVVYEHDQPIGCGAFKPYSDEAAEIKRMYVRPDHRGKRVGAVVLTDLEAWAKEVGYTECVLETGHKQKAAVKLYQNAGYQVLPNYGQYAGVDNSVCMRKALDPMSVAA